MCKVAENVEVFALGGIDAVLNAFHPLGNVVDEAEILLGRDVLEVENDVGCEIAQVLYSVFVAAAALKVRMPR